jgi:spore coat protein U-like protein
MAFGTLNQLGGTASDSQTNVTVTCTPGVSYNVGLDMGANAMGGVRRMAAALGGEAVPYALYTNASRTTAWGNTVGTNTVAGTASLLPSTLTVYGRVGGDAGLVPAGVYADLVTVTVTF